MPILIQHLPLTPPQEESLRRLWSDAGLTLLRSIVKAKANVQLVEAVEKVYESNGDKSDTYEAGSLVIIADAKKYRHFIEVLDEISKEKEHFLVKLNPPTA